MNDEQDGAVVESWHDLSRADLVEEAKARNLVITGNKQQLAERLEAYDRENPEQDEELPFEPDNPPGPDDEPEGPELVGDGQGDADPAPNPYDPADDESDQPSGSDEPKVVFQQAVPSGNTFHAEFDLPAGYELLEEDLDHDWKLQARNQAIAAGHTPLGGAYAAHNIGFGSRDGKVTIIYNVPVKVG